MELNWISYKTETFLLFLHEPDFIYLFVYFHLHYTACGILVPRPGIKLTPPAVEAQS